MSVISRAKRVFRDLGAADGVAGLDHRTAEDLRGILALVRTRYGGGAKLESLAVALNAYPKAYRRAVRDPMVSPFFAVTAEGSPEYPALDCRACGQVMRPTRLAVMQHVISVPHVIRADAEPRR